MKINPQLQQSTEDYLYLLNLELTPDNLAKFKNIRYVLMQGSGQRAKSFAKKLAKEILNVDPRFFEPQDLTATSRYNTYRVGNVLSVSHGMGNTSIIGLLQDLTKLLYYAGNSELEYIRIGTSGGIGVDPGSVIITKQAYMPNLQPFLAMPALDKIIQVPTNFNAELGQRIIAAQPQNLPFKLFFGNSIAADDFYLGQGRFDGAIKHTNTLKDKQDYLQKVSALNIYNFEMESTAMAAFCQRVNIPASMIAVTLLNRMLGDQVTASPELLAEYSDRSQLVASNYLLSQAGIS